MYILFYFAGILWCVLASTTPFPVRPLMLGAGCAICFIAGIRQGRQEVANKIREDIMANNLSWASDCKHDESEICDNCRETKE